MGPLLLKGRDQSFQTSLPCSRGGISLPSMPHVLRVWHILKERTTCWTVHLLHCVLTSTHRQLGTAYVSATTGAVATALGLKSLTKVNAPHLPFICFPFLHHLSIPTYRLPTSLPPELLTTPWPLGLLSDILLPPAPAPPGWQICALCSGGSCQLHQHPPDEAEVSGSSSWHACPVCR